MDSFENVSIFLLCHSEIAEYQQGLGHRSSIAEVMTHSFRVFVWKIWANCTFISGQAWKHKVWMDWHVIHKCYTGMGTSVLINVYFGYDCATNPLPLRVLISSFWNGIIPPALLTKIRSSHGFHVFYCFRMFLDFQVCLENLQNKICIAFRSNCSGSRVSWSLDASFQNRVLDKKVLLR